MPRIQVPLICVFPCFRNLGHLNNHMNPSSGSCLFSVILQSPNSSSKKLFTAALQRLLQTMVFLSCFTISSSKKIFAPETVTTQRLNFNTNSLDLSNPNPLFNIQALSVHLLLVSTTNEACTSFICSKFDSRS